jgi:hypothetical protein
VLVLGRLIADPKADQLAEPLLLIRSSAQVGASKSRVPLVHPQGLSPKLVIGDCSWNPTGPSPVSPRIVDEVDDLGYKELVNKRQTLPKTLTS